MLCNFFCIIHYCFCVILIFALLFFHICSMFHLFKVIMFTSSSWQWCFALYTFHFHYMCVSIVLCALHFNFCFHFQALQCDLEILLLFFFKLCFLLLQVFGFNCWSSYPSTLFCSITSFSLFLFTFVALLLDFDVVELQFVFTFIFWLFNSIAFAFCQVITLVSTYLLFTLNHLDNM